MYFVTVHKPKRHVAFYNLRRGICVQRRGTDIQRRRIYVQRRGTKFAQAPMGPPRSIYFVNTVSKVE